MMIEKLTKASFYILGKQKWVEKGCGVKDVWEDANCHFDEVLSLAAKTDEGKLIGVWGAMSDKTMHFLPWTHDFSEGFYLAGVECNQDVVAPIGWTRWTLPSLTYLKVKIETNYPQIMEYMLNEYLPQHHLRLCAAIQEFYNPAEDGQLYLLFPIEKPK